MWVQGSRQFKDFNEYLVPKHPVSQVVGYIKIKGKSAIHLARTYSERKRNFWGEHFWA